MMKHIDLFVPHIQQILLWMLPIITIACNPPNIDKEIKSDITLKAKDDINFAGVYYTVENRNVTLWGNCPTEKSRNLVKQKLSTIHVIKGVNDRILIAPVTVGSNFTMKRQVDSVLAEYPGLSTVISGTALKVVGKVDKKYLQKLHTSLRDQNNLNK